MRQELLPEPSDNIWETVQDGLLRLDRVREELLTSASYYWTDRFPFFQTQFESWRIISGLSFSEVVKTIPEAEYSNLEKARLLIGIYHREDQLRVDGINEVAASEICQPIEIKSFAANHISQLIPKLGWDTILNEFVAKNTNNMNIDFRKLLSSYPNLDD